MELRKEFESETGIKALFYRQDYSGQKPYKDGFNDDYVEWLEDKIDRIYQKGFEQGYDNGKEDAKIK